MTSPVRIAYSSRNQPMRRDVSRSASTFSELLRDLSEHFEAAREPV
jgi:hypothetical protein